MKKIVFSFVLAVMMILSFSTVAFAEVTNQVRPNYTADEAQLMLRNTFTMTQYQSANFTLQHVISGSLLTATEEDWYKVYLPANPSGDNTFLSINCQNLMAQVIDDDGNVLFEQRYVKSTNHMGARSYRVNIPADGYYYIRVYDRWVSDGAYLITMGGPNYSGSRLDYTAPASLTLNSSTSTVQATYDLSNASVPAGSVVYQVTLLGTTSGSVRNEYRRILYANETDFTPSTSYSWQANISPSLNKLVANNWTFRWLGTTSTTATITPNLTFWYDYPLLPELF